MSIVYICADAYLETINAITDFYGYGSGNITIRLVDVNGNIFWGCHTYEPLFNNPPPEEITGSAEALAALYERYSPGSEPLDNWNAALAENGLSRAEQAI